MSNFTGEENKGDVIRIGSCARFGHDLVRIVEPKETYQSRSYAVFGEGN